MYMYVHMYMYDTHVCIMHMISMYVLCLVFVTKYEDKLLSYGCSGKVMK